MISYKHTLENRLTTPDKYMYSAFQGSDFISAYHQDRLKHLTRFSTLDSENHNHNHQLSSELNSKVTQRLTAILRGSRLEKFEIGCMNKGDYVCSDKIITSIDLSVFEITNEICSRDLLVSLVSQQLNGGDPTLIKYWLDRLLQRFEVTKKIYEVYPKNLSKGIGEGTDIFAYWIFSVSLILHYKDTHSVKYLNTLLKVIDLLCSLEDRDLINSMMIQDLSLVLLVELSFIEYLSRNIKGLSYEFT